MYDEQYNQKQQSISDQYHIFCIPLKGEFHIQAPIAGQMWGEMCGQMFFILRELVVVCSGLVQHQVYEHLP